MTTMFHINMVRLVKAVDFLEWVKTIKRPEIESLDALEPNQIWDLITEYERSLEFGRTGHLVMTAPERDAAYESIARIVARRPEPKDKSDSSTE
jgi:hypothetical protein